MKSDLKSIRVEKVEKDDVVVTVEDLTNTNTVINPCLWKLLICSGVLIYSSYTILLHLCAVDGKIPFKSSSMVLLIEMMKLVISAIMYIPVIKTDGQYKIKSFSMVLLFSIPAILYCINNNLDIFIQLEMDPVTYQVLSNFKILTTALLFRIFIKKPISKVQWLALYILVFAGMTNSFGGWISKNDNNNPGNIYINIKGLIMLLVFCTISGLAGVFTEFLLKKDNEMSLYLQNCLLYSFGIIFNGILFLYQANKTQDFTLFSGYTWHTWVLIFSQAIIGLIMAVIMKHSNNITRLFLISTSMVVTVFLSMIVFGLKLNEYLILSTIMVISALKLYYK